MMKSICTQKMLGLIVIILLIYPNMSFSQNDDFRRKVEIIENGFKSRNIEEIRSLLDPELTFPPIPKEQTAIVLNQIITKFPKLQSLKIVSYSQDSVLLNFSFEGMRSTESTILFNKLGKIVKFEFIEDVIFKEMERRMSVPKPSPGELAKLYPSETVTFKSTDGLEVSGDMYYIGDQYPIILLCHQGMFNKYEYADIAPKLNKLGFNCLAIDQRSGGTLAGHYNTTFENAKKQKLNTDFLEAEKDIRAAINYLTNKFNKDIILWGSSYSSILVLNNANNEKVSAIISFSPSDYFKDDIPLIKDLIASIEKPFFITSSKRESIKLKKSIDKPNLRLNQIYFIPVSKGFHGSKSLWEGQEGSDEYWLAISNFLQDLI